MAVTSNPWLSASASASASVASSAPAHVPAVAPVSAVFAPAGGFHLLGQRTEEQRAAQAELVARAFATPDLEREFEEEKQKEAEAEGPAKKVETVLPGWGGWAGEGLKAPRKPVAKPKPAATSTFCHPASPPCSLLVVFFSGVLLLEHFNYSRLCQEMHRRAKIRR